MCYQLKLEKCCTVPTNRLIYNIKEPNLPVPNLPTVVSVLNFFVKMIVLNLFYLARHFTMFILIEHVHTFYSPILQLHTCTIQWSTLFPSVEWLKVPVVTSQTIIQYKIIK